MVVERRSDNGALVCNGWVAKKVIDARRDTSDSFIYAEKPGNEWAKDSSPWHAWYVEQAMKTAMHYAINRGWCIIDDTEAVRALSTDAEADYVVGDDGETRRTQRASVVTKRVKVADAGVARLAVDASMPIDSSGLTEAEKEAILREEAGQ